jgi:hypothetical protein
MALGLSLFLIAVGAILAFAVTFQTAGVDLTAVGWILMIVGFIGVVLSMLFWASFAPFGNRRVAHIDHRDVALPPTVDDIRRGV